MGLSILGFGLTLNLLNLAINRSSRIQQFKTVVASST
jgi:hypothetical protein